MLSMNPGSLNLSMGVDESVINFSLKYLFPLQKITHTHATYMEVSHEFITENRRIFTSHSGVKKNSRNAYDPP